MTQKKGKKQPQSEESEILSEIKNAKESIPTTDTEVKNQETLEPIKDDQSVKEDHAIHELKTEQSIIDLTKKESAPEPEELPEVLGEEEYEEIDTASEDYHISKWLTLMDDNSMPTTIDLSTVQMFSALSDDEINNLFTPEELEAVPQFREGIIVHTKLIPGGFTLFGIDHATFDEAVRDYEERGI